MSRTLTAAAIVFLFAVGSVWAAEDVVTDASERPREEKQDPEITKLFNTAVDLLGQKKYDEARVMFEKVLSLNPNASMALTLRNQAKQQAIIDAFMEAPDDTRDTLKKFLSIAERGRRDWLRDQKRIAELVENLTIGNFDKMWAAIYELRTAGQHAVPQLVETLRKTKPDVHSKISMSLMHTGQPVVLPLSEALKVKDSVVKHELVFVLGQIKDSRALPALAALYTGNELPSVKESALEAIKRIIGDGQVKSAPVCYLEEAYAYYQKKFDVLQAPHEDFIIWNWDAETQSLTQRNVPEYAFYLEMAEKLCYEALTIDDSFQSVYPLLICTYFQQLHTIDLHLDEVEKGQTADLTPEDIAGLKARKDRITNILSTTSALGKQHFYAALNLALADGNAAVAVSCESALRQLGSMGDLPVIVGDKKDRKIAVAAAADPLVAALDSDNKQIRYNAAAALAAMAGRSAFRGLDKVIPTLCDALGERGARVALVADSDIQVINQLKVELGEQSFIVDAAADESAALNTGYAVPMKDVLIVDAGFKKAIDRFLTDYRSRKVPVILLVTDANAKETKATYDGRVAAFVAKPVQPADMQAALVEAFKDIKDTSGKAVALGMNYTAAKALANIDVTATALPVQDAIDALAKSLALPDEVRLESMKALTNIGTHFAAAQAVQNDLCMVAGNGANSTSARLASLEALTAIAIKNSGTTDAVKEVAEKLLLDKEAEIRKAAALLIGASASSTGPVMRLLGNANWVGEPVKVGAP